jgi:hypothetical protein
MYRLTLLWLCICAACSTLAYWRGRKKVQRGSEI